LGPPVISPVERMCSMIERWASAWPMESWVKARPLGAMAAPPAFSTRSASGMSLVTTTSPGSVRSAIQSSATSGPASTIIRSIKGEGGIWMKLLETTRVFRP
jgi:hypothetical protein